MVSRIRGQAVGEVRQLRLALAAAEVRAVVGEAVLIGVLVLPWPLLGFLEGVPLEQMVWSACAVGVVLPARRRWPASALVVAAALFGAGVPPSLFVAPVVAFGAGRRIVSTGRRVAAFLASTAAIALPAVVTGGRPWTAAGQDAGAALAIAGFMLMMPFAIGLLLGERQTRLRALQERNEYLEQARALAEAQARAKERTHIAGEMHDLLGHRLSLISVYAGGLELATAQDAPQVSEHAELIRATSHVALSELREILGVLRIDPQAANAPAPDEDTGTRADVTRLVEASQQAGVTVELQWEGDDLDTADLRTRRAVHRLVREGLTNVLKHAAAAPARVQVTRTASRVQVTVENQPEAHPAPRLPGTTSGLISLQERVHLLAGDFTSGPTPDGGFRIHADLPMHPSTTDSSPSPIPPPVTPAIPVAQRTPPAPGLLTTPRLLGAGCLLAVLVPMALVLLGALYVLADSVEPADYAALTLGDDEASVKERFGNGEGLAHLIFLSPPRNQHPPTPAGASCGYYPAAADDVLTYRLCFRNGLLVGKDSVGP